jgi:hypothetical protein
LWCFLPTFCSSRVTHFKHRLVELAGARIESQRGTVEVFDDITEADSALPAVCSVSRFQFDQPLLALEISLLALAIACDASSSRTVFSASGDAVGGDTAAASDSSSG